MKEHVYGVQYGRYNSKYTISVFRAIVGYIENLQQGGFSWYQGSIINLSLMYVYWK